MVLYNVTNATSSVNFLTQTQAVHQLSGGIFGPAIFLTVVALFFMLYRFNTDAENEVVIALTMWFGTILAGIMVAMNLLQLNVLYITIVLSFASIGLLYFKNN